MKVNSKIRQRESLLIVGLGNPGYEDTRHNIGFKTLDRLALKLGIELKRQEFKSGGGEYGEEGYIKLLKPLAYMNNSGLVIKEVMEAYKLSSSSIKPSFPLPRLTTTPTLLIIYDDMDIPLGQLRIRYRGSAGGHNGMRSIIKSLESEDIKRIRIGIGRPIKEDKVEYVLGKLTREENKVISEVIEISIEAIEVIINEGMDKAMSKYNHMRIKYEGDISIRN